MKRRKYRKKSNFSKFIIAFIIILLFGASGMIYELYSRIYQPNIVFNEDAPEQYIYIPTDSDFAQVVSILSNSGMLININSFEWLANQKKYVKNIKPGRYKIDRAFNNNDLVNLLRSGNQKPVKVTFNNIRTKEELAGVVANQIEADSISIIQYISDSIVLQNLGFNYENVACIFLPNTYEFYWNTSAEQFVYRMIREYSFFWDLNRRAKADAIELSLYEVSILASIVEKEQSVKFDERPLVAGLYLNRIRRGMNLESDPTLIFALKDFTIRRVLNKDKKIDSPYNTYNNSGLPPGPICIPSINAIDAVLNATSHNFIFMCAKEDFSGYHNFARTYAKHLINARKYQKVLNKRKIMR